MPFCDFAHDIIRYLFSVIVIQIDVLVMLNAKIPASWYVDIRQCFRGVNDQRNFMCSKLKSAQQETSMQ